MFIKARILTGAFGLPLVAVMIFFAPPMLLNVALAVVSAVAVREIIKATKHDSHTGIVSLSMFFAACAPFFKVNSSLFPAFAIAFTYLLSLCIMLVKFHDKMKVNDVAFSFFATVSYSIAFSCISYLRVLSPHGKFYVTLGFVIPWMSDIGAYFVGTLFGKHKLAPTISPKKTIEGLVGGVLISLLSSLAVAFLYQQVFTNGLEINYAIIVIIALVGAFLSVFGDLFASVIKRQYDIKDFGNIFPGHGGMMDRFDSFLFCMPVLYLVALNFPFVK